MKRQSTGTQLVLFLAVSYGHLWFLFGVGILFDIPFTYCPRRLGGQLVLVGIPASLIAAVTATLIAGSSEDVRLLFGRSLDWRLSPAWCLAGTFRLLPAGWIARRVASNAGTSFTDMKGQERTAAIRCPHQTLGQHAMSSSPDELQCTKTHRLVLAAPGIGVSEHHAVALYGDNRMTRDGGTEYT
jgi:hypothetical protein